jgi:microcystin-dependent protein
MADFKIDSEYALDKNGYAMSYPVGTILGIFSSTVPSGWLVCNGQTLSYSDYPTLGALFGVSSGSFNLPDLNNKMLSTIAVSESVVDTTHTHGTLANPAQVVGTTTINAHTHNSTVNHTAGDMAAHTHLNANGSGHSYGNNNNNASNRATGNTTFIAGRTHNHNYMEYWYFSDGGGASNAHQHTAKSVPVNASYNHTHGISQSIQYSEANTAFPLSLYIYYIIKS